MLLAYEEKTFFRCIFFWTLSLFTIRTQSSVVTNIRTVITFIRCQLRNVSLNFTCGHCVVFFRTGLISVRKIKWTWCALDLGTENSVTEHILWNYHENVANILLQQTIKIAAISAYLWFWLWPHFKWIISWRKTTVKMFDSSSKNECISCDGRK